MPMARCAVFATGDMGIGKDGEATDNYAPGMELSWRNKPSFLKAAVAH